MKIRRLYKFNTASIFLALHYTILHLFALVSNVIKLLTTRYRPLWDVTDDSWPATVHSVVPSLLIILILIIYRPIGLLEKATQKQPKWQNRAFDRESDGRF